MLKKILLIFLFIPSLSWGKETYLSCYNGLHDIKLRLIIEKSFKNNLTIIHNNLNSEIKLIDYKTSFEFKDKIRTSWFPYSPIGYFEEVKGKIDKFNLNFDVTHLEAPNKKGDVEIPKGYYLVSQFKCKEIKKKL